MITTKIYRSTKDKFLFGVAGGLAEYFDIDPVLVRLAFVFFCFFSGAGLLVYVVLAILLPKEQSSDPDTHKEGLEKSPGETRYAGQDVGGGSRNTLSGPSEERRRNSFVLVIIALGAIILCAGPLGFWGLGWVVGWSIF